MPYSTQMLFLKIFKILFRMLSNKKSSNYIFSKKIEKFKSYRNI